MVSSRAAERFDAGWNRYEVTRHTRTSYAVAPGVDPCYPLSAGAKSGCVTNLCTSMTLPSLCSVLLTARDGLPTLDVFRTLAA